MPLTIGLTGGIGAGKSTVAQLLAEHGAAVVSGDELGRIVVESSPEILLRLRERFGDDIFDSSGLLQRRELGKRAFASPAETRWLTAITRDPILQLWRDRVRRCTVDVIVLDAALIFEWGVETKFDLTVTVLTPPEQATARITADGRLTHAEATSRLAAQLDPLHKARQSSFELLNDGTRETLRSRVADFWSNSVQPELIRKQQSTHGQSHP